MFNEYFFNTFYSLDGTFRNSRKTLNTSQISQTSYISKWKRGHVAEVSALE